MTTTDHTLATWLRQYAERAHIAPAEAERMREAAALIVEQSATIDRHEAELEKQDKVVADHREALDRRWKAQERLTIAVAKYVNSSRFEPQHSIQRELRDALKAAGSEPRKDLSTVSALQEPSQD